MKFINSIVNYFKNSIYELHLFKLLGFSANDYSTYKIASLSKRTNRDIWIFNNVLVPVGIIISPYLLTLIHDYFGTVAYSKSIFDILISGSLTLLGINVLRTASTSLSENIDNTKIPKQLVSDFNALQNKIEDIRSKLYRKSWSLTAIGALFYLLQIGQFVNSSNNAMYFVLFFVLFISVYSIFCARFMSLMKSNFIQNEEVIPMLFNRLLKKRDDFNNLEEQLRKKGI
jgi:hypothetical protein